MVEANNDYEMDGVDEGAFEDMDEDAEGWDDCYGEEEDDYETQARKIKEELEREK